MQSFGNDGRMTEEMWVNAMKLWRTTKLKAVDLREGVFWTNRYIANIPKE